MTLGTYYGDEKLVFAFDVGTTMSAVTFAHFEDGEEPRIRLVTRWPGQEEAASDCKVPTVVRYTSGGHAVQFGTEAVENIEGLEETALAKWFKLFLHPAAMRTRNNLTPPALPRGVTLKTVYADMLAYLFKHARQFVDASSLDPLGRGSLWTRLKSNFFLIMAIPNGWDNSQQAFLREAVVAAGILPFDHDYNRLQFVSESEASVHFAINYANIGTWLREGTTFAVCDAGGSTVDTTVYKCMSAAPRLRLEEVTSSECVQAGSALLDQEARRLLQQKLIGSKYGTREIIDIMVQEFERKTKRKFDGSQQRSVIQFGHTYDNDRPWVIAGRVTLTCEEVEDIFKDIIESVVGSIENILSRAGACEALLMVGGFAESAYLQSVLRTRIKGARLISIDEATKKAAAEGALAWHAKLFVAARAARATYGTVCSKSYDCNLTTHREREHMSWVASDGRVKLNGFFDAMITMNQVVQNDKSVKYSYCTLYSSLPTMLENMSTTLVCIDSETPGQWYKDEAGTVIEGFRTICTLTADLSGLARNLRIYRGVGGRKYWKIDYSIEIFFGQTSLCASLVWQEDGQTRKGPVSVIPNSLF